MDQNMQLSLTQMAQWKRQWRVSLSFGVYNTVKGVVQYSNVRKCRVVVKYRRNCTAFKARQACDTSEHFDTNVSAHGSKYSSIRRRVLPCTVTGVSTLKEYREEVDSWLLTYLFTYSI